MSQKRQTGLPDRSSDRISEITTFTKDYSAGHVVAWHFHDRDQVVYASRGVMTIRTGAGTWVVPPYRAVWIPAGISHTIAMSGAVAMRTLYLKRGLARRLPRNCCVVNVSSLLRELILHACMLGRLARKTKSDQHFIGVILTQLEVVEMVPLQLPHVSDPRARRVAETLRMNLSDSRTLTQICNRSGASKRTVERIFREEVGMTLGKWRQQVRLMEAVRLLAGGAKVTHAALEAGYSTPSAFISMFKKSLGMPPTEYFKPTRSPRFPAK